ncbi:malto-oligosyltrehalose synthase [Cupriavidus lacunae]|uniref:Malto-oligosyltrehalose synthase n=1 Tax=Cupriavidus lacunae TaxID=2666307 RepID=A0A370NXQ2_9BURK|nr:malto-oligosyltrehalose synthase [Cupriavidus lacunae]RDK10380.1 malto-oligosyltrehalose synthase [Cupriavidus lacunae]
MNLASILSTMVLASSVSVSSAPVERQLLAITPSDFAQRFNTVAQDTGSGLTLPSFKVEPGWHRAAPSSGVSVLVRASRAGYVIDEVVVVCREVERCFLTICTAALAIDDSVNPLLLQRFIVARIATELGEVGLVMSGLAYIVVTPKEDDYVAVVIRPYLTQDRSASPSQAAREPPDDAHPPQHGHFGPHATPHAAPHGVPLHPHGPLTPTVGQPAPPQHS